MTKVSNEDFFIVFHFFRVFFRPNIIFSHLLIVGHDWYNRAKFQFGFILLKRSVDYFAKRYSKLKIYEGKFQVTTLLILLHSFTTTVTGWEICNAVNQRRFCPLLLHKVLLDSLQESWAFTGCARGIEGLDSEKMTKISRNAQSIISKNSLLQLLKHT